MKFVLLWLVPVLLAGCGGAAPAASTPTPSPFPTRAALPATWTPTRTPRPPTLAPTPTITPTATITPTPDADARCASFVLLSRPPEGASLPWNAVVTFAWLYPASDAAVTLRVEHAGGAGLEAGVPGPAPAVVQVPYRALPGAGVYTWTLTPQDAAGRPLRRCAARGTFTLALPANPTPD